MRRHKADEKGKEKTVGTREQADANYAANVTAAKQGDVGAFEALYNGSVKYFNTVIYPMVKSQDDREDILQEVYIQIFKNINTLESPDSFLPWGASICRNAALTYLRTQKRKWDPVELRPMASEDEQEGMDALSAADERDGFTDPQEQLDAMETKRLLDEMINELPEMQRACIMLWQQGLSTTEISERLDIPKGTVNSNVNYAKKKIKEKVLILEKNGTKLYSLSPIPFFLWLLSQFEENGSAVMPDGSPALFQAAIKDAGINVTGTQSVAQPEAPKALPEAAGDQQGVQNTVNAELPHGTPNAATEANPAVHTAAHAGASAPKSILGTTAKAAASAAGKAGAGKIAALAIAGCVAVGGGAVAGYSTGIFHSGSGSAEVKTTIDEETAERDTQGEESNNTETNSADAQTRLEDSDQDGMPDVFVKAVADYYQRGILPDGEKDDNYDFASPVSYAAYDVDADGQEELVIQHSETYAAAQFEGIYSYEDGVFKEELMEFPLTVYYDNGVMFATWHQYGGFNIYRYNQESGRYEIQGAVWPLPKEDYDTYSPREAPDSFPNDIDADGDGLVYWPLTFSSEGERQYNLDSIIDGPEYEEYLDQFIGGAEVLDIPYREYKYEDLQALPDTDNPIVINLDDYVDFYYLTEDGTGAAEFWMKEDEFYEDYENKLVWDTGNPEGELAREVRNNKGITPEYGVSYSLLYCLSLDMDGTPTSGYHNGDVINFYWTMSDELVESLEALYGCRLEFSPHLTFTVEGL